MITMLLAILVADPDPVALEESGLLWQAGAAWQAEGSVEGQARVICRLLEEALYAGHANRASWLIEDLESLSPEPGLSDYWNGRLAWACGLDSTAIALLQSVDGGQWIEHRAAGTAFVYMGRPADAVDEFELALASGSTLRRKFWAAVDLCFACIQDGDLDRASEVCAILEMSWPTEGIPPILRALILRERGRETEAQAVLQALLSTQDAAVADMAGMLLEESR
jgi:tetratricopeptide (TPR) repeat protein